MLLGIETLPGVLSGVCSGAKCPLTTLKSLSWGKALAKGEAAAKLIGNVIAAKAT